MSKRGLIIIDALVFGLPGVKILLTGINAYREIGFGPWWLWAISVTVLTGFLWMFARIVRRYSQRIAELPEDKASPLKAFSPKGYILVVFMMALGIALKHIPSIPAEFTASFYCGLGPALIASGVMFLSRLTELQNVEER